MYERVNKRIEKIIKAVAAAEFIRITKCGCHSIFLLLHVRTIGLIHDSFTHSFKTDLKIKHKYKCLLKNWGLDLQFKKTYQAMRTFVNIRRL